MSVYLPPDSRAEALAALQAAAAPDTPLALVAGDINLQLEKPRDPGETRDVELRKQLLDRWCLCPLACPGATRRGPRGASSIDTAAVPQDRVGAWQTTLRWRPGLSDHA
eukprot:6950161-Alexandrium_andersonii.AAC.1